MTFDDATRSVLSVGGGRGFVVQGLEHLDAEGYKVERIRRYVITAGHCLPHLPPCLSFSGTDERTFQALLGHLAGSQMVWAECLFVDPIADIAVLGVVDPQEWPEQAEAYADLVEPLPALTISDPPSQGTGRLLSLDRSWYECDVFHLGGHGPLWFETPKGTESGMSGSPNHRQ